MSVSQVEPNLRAIQNKEEIREHEEMQEKSIAATPPPTVTSQAMGSKEKMDQPDSHKTAKRPLFQGESTNTKKTKKD